MLIGNPVFKHSFWREYSQPPQDIVENGAKACAFSMSSLLLWYTVNRRRLCGDRHTTVSGFLLDISRCRWFRVSPRHKPEYGDIVHWAERRGNEHVGLYIGEGYAISTNRHTGCLTKHAWDYEADGSAPREVVDLWRHPELAEQAIRFSRDRALRV